MSDQFISESVKNYYGQVLKSNQDLKTSACCTLDAIPYHIRSLLQELHPEVIERFYGCGSPLPPALEGCTVLDLGCGSGRDCYLLSRLVGESGRVIGIDMTEEQLAVARQHCDWHAQKYGYAQSNIDFVQGYIEDLTTAGIADNSVDLVVSNCVVNLSPDKKKVLAEVLRVLKPGGELYFSDVYADRRIPQALQKDPVLLGECLAGALYWEDFRRIMQELGCPDVRIVKDNPITLDDPEVIEKIGMVHFRSVTIRVFKIPLEDRCEDFGQIAIYNGRWIKYFFDSFIFETGKPLRVCGNTADMISLTRFAQHFQILGDKSVHFGLFDCAPPNTSLNPAQGAACC